MKFLATIVFVMLTAASLAQQGGKWEKWSWLIGSWKGEGSGQPGMGGGTFSFQPDLNEKVLIRKSHSEYPASGTRPATVHDDLMIVYLDMQGNPSKAIYFDNEGHTINYSIEYTTHSVVLTSDKIPNVPVFRLSYELMDNNYINTKFELSKDGEHFNTYLEGRCKKGS